MMEQSVEDIINKIVDSNKLTRQEVLEQIKLKTESLGGLISQEGAAHIIANELGITITNSPASESKLKDLSAGMKNVTVLVKILQKYDIRSFGADNSGKVGSIFVGDETGFCRITFWNDKTKYLDGLKEGDIILIQHAYTKENNDRIEIHMGNASHCIANPAGKTVEVKERQEQPSAQVKQIGELEDSDSFVTINATIVQIYNPSFFEVCPECNKRLKQEGDDWICQTHGKQKPTYNYVVNAFLDDGSGNIRATFWKEQTNKLFNLSGEEFLAFKENQEALEEAKMDLLGHMVSIRARLQINQAYNTKELVAYEIEKNPAPETPSKSTTQPESTKQVEENILGEVDDDDEEILSIDDIGEDI
jgi:replication factor A1